jgi:hypothetical protein
MNERIRELVEQAGFGSYAEIPDTYIVHKNDLVEFAELIVRECASLTLDHKSDDYYNGWLDYRDEIKKHFGVEE